MKRHSPNAGKTTSAGALVYTGATSGACKEMVMGVFIAAVVVTERMAMLQVCAL
jgi:cystathionine beta-lyase family protein involved in aluminum resistance